MAHEVFVEVPVQTEGENKLDEIYLLWHHYCNFSDTPCRTLSTLLAHFEGVVLPHEGEPALFSIHNLAGGQAV